MGLDVFVVGTDSDSFDETTRWTVSKMLAQIRRQNAALVPFELGQINGMPGNEWAEVGGCLRLHRLRGYAAHLELIGVPPAAPHSGPGYYAQLDEAYNDLSKIKRFRHLIDHEDNGGYYFPLDFAKPFELRETGSSVGSSPRLLDELLDLNQHLQVPENHPMPGSPGFASIIDGDPWETEKDVWAVLHWFARESVDRKLLLVFA